MNRKERVISVLSYLWILALVPILWREKSDKMNSHARSGLVLLILWILLFFIFRIPLVGVVLGVLTLIAILVFTVWGIYDAARGDEAKIPGVEKIAVYFK